MCFKHFFDQNIFAKLPIPSGTHFFCSEKCCKNYADKIARIGFF